MGTMLGVGLCKLMKTKAVQRRSEKKTRSMAQNMSEDVRRMLSM